VSALHTYAPAAGPHAAIELLTGHGVRDQLEDLMGLCCMGVANGGPDYCTCWEPEHDLVQSLQLDADSPLVVAPKCCHDCAYRNGSPERSGDEADWLLELPSEQAIFFCHQGIRRVLRYRHPAGIILPTGPGDYDPPRGEGRVFRADGSPAEICAGFAAYRSALLGVS
jgi:hypothetical protein